MPDSARILFMGTPDFAVPSLRMLHENGFHVPLVVTQPDRPKGRGRKPQPPAIKLAAQEMGLPLLQVKSLRDATVRNTIRDIRPDVILLIAFGQLLSKSMLEIPPLGALNIHASLLPKYRGPAPIQWAIIGCEAETGVTFMRMDEGVDTGDVLATETTPIHPDDTSESLHERLSHLGADLLARKLAPYLAGELAPVGQDHSQASRAPMIRKTDGRMPWEKSAVQLDCFVRGMTPWPGAFTFWDEKRLRIHRVTAIEGIDTADAAPGTVINSSGDVLWVATGDGVLSLDEIQSASGKRMPAANFLKGNRIPECTRLS